LGGFSAWPWLKTLGWLGTIVMGLAAVVMFATM